MTLLIIMMAVLAALFGATAVQPAPYPQTTAPPISLPPDWQQRFIRYATVDDPDRLIVRHIHIDPEAHARLRPGMPAPDGTLLVMADTHARLDTAGQPLRDGHGRFLPEPGWIAIFAQQKDTQRSGSPYAGLRNGNWGYAVFDGAGQRRNVSLASCFTCHQQARAAQDYTFTLWDYAATLGLNR